MMRERGRGKIFYFISLLALALQCSMLPVVAQEPQPAPSTTGEKSSSVSLHSVPAPIASHLFTGVTLQSPANASSVTQTSSATLTTLSFQQAVQLALENNLQSLLARERIREAEGRATQSRAGLLPNLSGSVVQTDQTTNLAALGFRPGLFPGFNSPLLGPFQIFDARLRLAQSIFNFSALRQAAAGNVDVNIARLQEQLTRQQVTTQTALAYLNVLSAARAVDAAQANVTQAQTLLKLAQDQRAAGVAAGVDVTRAETRLAEEQVRLAQAQTTVQQTRLELLRLVGLPLSSSVTLSDTLQFTTETAPSAEVAIEEAGRERLEIRLATEQVRLNTYNRQAAQGEQLPSVDFLADYGESGNTPRENALPTRSYGVRVNVPIFNGGLTRGRIAAAESRERQAELQLRDTRAQVEQDVRNAIQTLGTAAEQVRAAQQAVQLAERELQMSRDRFAAGVANNIEVITAQTALADARNAEVNALAVYNAARINLASARGRVEAFRWQ